MLRLFKKKLPDCEGLFQKYFVPWYPDEAKPKMTRPDLYTISGYEGRPIDFDEVQYLRPEYIERQKVIINETMVRAALSDFQSIFKSDQLDLNVLDAVDKYYGRNRIAKLINSSDPSDFSNPYVVTVCEFGVMLGQLYKQLDGYDWLYSYPYFHSIIVHKNTGIAITVFDWAIQKFSEDGVDDGFLAKFHSAVEHINSKSENK
jgi:hypothetical protein